jgi:hypothetical protein
MTNYTTQVVKPINCLWLVIDPNITNRSYGNTRSVVIVAENEKEVIEFLDAAHDKGDAVSSKARIDSYLSWPEESLNNDFWMNDFRSKIDNCKIINIGIASSDISKGFLVVDNID